MLQVNLSPDNYLFRMNDVSRELYIVAGGVVELVIEQEDQSEITESVRSAGQVSVAAFAQRGSLAGTSVACVQVPCIRSAHPSPAFNLLHCSPPLILLASAEPPSSIVAGGG